MNNTEYTERISKLKRVFKLALHVYLSTNFNITDKRIVETDHEFNIEGMIFKADLYIPKYKMAFMIGKTLNIWQISKLATKEIKTVHVNSEVIPKPSNCHEITEKAFQQKFHRYTVKQHYLDNPLHRPTELESQQQFIKDHGATICPPSTRTTEINYIT